MTRQLAHSPARPVSVQRLLLGCGVVAGPVYVTVALAQALTRAGFDLARHPWSFLANGDLGWIQTANFVLTALATIAAAAGLRRGLAPGRGALWAPILIGAFGTSMTGAALFPADPAMGFPAGTPEGPGHRDPVRDPAHGRRRRRIPVHGRGLLRHRFAVRP
ncbi:DUF998 domain-containing protein [Nonomuraea lactucae]|uniref:DUF998 domain-containing protein n=1 Tax=Nonomuraea lactucae TaxID=2249762 RepID=UPI0023DD39E2|nr:DUF998 domain-containing protein [Nonomuraea lactucae]